MSRAKNNASLSSLIQTSVGSLITSDADSLEVLEVGTDGYVLTADSGEPNGVKWAAAAAAGSGLSEGQITDLTDAGDSTLHYHATDRALGNATGTLAVANGGTGQTTAQAAINALTGVSGASAGQVLTKSGSNAAWVSPSGAGLGDVSTSGSATDSHLVVYNGSSGDSIKDGGILASSVATLADSQTLTNKTMHSGSVWNGTAVGATFGGTAQTSYTKGDILYSSATNTLAKLPVGTVGQTLQVSAAGVPSWASGGATSDVWGNGGTIDRPYENYVRAGGVDTWPDGTTPENSLLRIGIGTSAISKTITTGDAPCGIFMQNYVKPAIGVGAYTTHGANFDMVVNGGAGVVTNFVATAYKMPGAYTGEVGIIGGRIGADARKATHYDGIITGFWAYVHGDRAATGGIAPSIEINSFCNQSWNTTSNYCSDAFVTNGKRSVMGLLINNYQHAVYEYGGSSGDYQNSFGIALASLGPGGIGGRGFGYQTGVYITDCSKENLRIRGGVFGSTSKSDYGIKIEGNQMNIAGIALGNNVLNFSDYYGSTWNNGDMWVNGGTLWIKLGGVNRQIQLV